MVVHDTFAYLAAGQNGLYIVNISDPTQPEITGMLPVSLDSILTEVSVNTHKRQDKANRVLSVGIERRSCRNWISSGRDRGLRTTAITQRPFGPEILILALMGWPGGVRRQRFPRVKPLGYMPSTQFLGSDSHLFQLLIRITISL